MINSSRVQHTLTHLLADPFGDLAGLAARSHPDLSGFERDRVVAEVRGVLVDLLREGLGVKEKTKDLTEGPFFGLLGHCAILRRVDERIRKSKKPQKGETASDTLSSLLGNLIPGTPKLEPSLLELIGRTLRVESGWDYWPDYRDVIKIRWPHQADTKRPDLRLGLYDRQANRINAPKLRRVAWWLLRCCPLNYIDPAQEGSFAPYRTALVHYLADQVVWLAPELRDHRYRVGDELDPVVEEWLRANRLVGELLPDKPDARRAFLKAFRQLHKLTVPIYVVPTEGLGRSGGNGDRVALLTTQLGEALTRLGKAEVELRGLRVQLEASPRAVPEPEPRKAGNEGPGTLGAVERLPDESKGASEEFERLQMRLDRLEADLASRSRESDRYASEAQEAREALARVNAELTAVRARFEPRTEPDASSLRGLREFLSAIDATYPLDTLWAIFQGQGTAITLPGLVNQFCLAMHRAGVIRYPNQQEFKLGYDQAGLYDRTGFEVAPGHEVLVRVESTGWAVKQGRTLLPVRRARVTPIPEPETPA